METPPSYLKVIPRGVHLALKIQPKGSRNEIVGPQGPYLKIKIAAAPTQGKANESLRQFLSETLRVPRKKIKILRGEKSRIKVVEILDISPKECLTVVSRPHYHGEKTGKS